MTAVQDGSPSEIGAAVRAARTGAGVSTRELARSTGVSQSMISMIENGRAQPSMATLFRLAEGLGIRAQELLPRTGSGDVHVISEATSPQFRITDASGAPDGQLLVSGPELLMEVIRYTLLPGMRHEQWFAHEGEEFLHVLSGVLQVELEREGGRVEVLEQGSMLHHDSRIPHRWTALGDQRAEVLLVTANPPGGSAHTHDDDS